jgi:glutamate 5-kinase
MDGGSNMLIASGKNFNPIQAIIEGGKATCFIAKTSPHLARKKWIAGMLVPNGNIYIDDGASKALKSGRSLLPAGIINADGQFERGDAVLIFDSLNNEVARGLTAYSVGETQTIKGKNTDEIENVLGYRGRSACIHRDDLVLTEEKQIDEK